MDLMRELFKSAADDDDDDAYYGPSGDDDEPRLSRPEDPRGWNSGFVGLQNLGSTCYLNSLLQTMYMTVPFRGRIFQLTDEELGAAVLDEIDAEEAERLRLEAEAARLAKAAGAAPAPAPVKEVDTFKDEEAYAGVVEQLKAYGFVEYAINAAIRAKDGNLADVNQLADYLFEYELPDDWEALWQREQDERAQRQQEKEAAEAAAAAASSQQDGSTAGGAVKRRGFRIIPLRLRQFFAQLQMLDQKTVSTQQLTRSFGWKNNNLGQQQDVVELNNVLFDAVHRSLKGIAGGENLIPSLYEFDIVTKIACQNCGRTSERVAHDPLLWAQVRACSTLPESLAAYVTPETLSAATDNAYECADCHANGLGKQTALMGPSIRRLPDVMQIALSRFGYSFSGGNSTRTKINSVLSFPLVIDMAPYLEDQVDSRLRAEKQRREEAKQAWLAKQAASSSSGSSDPSSTTTESSSTTTESSSTTTESSSTTTESSTSDENKNTEAASEASSSGLSKRQQRKLNREKQQQEQQTKKQKQKKNDQPKADKNSEPADLPLFVAEADINENSTELYDLLSVVVHSGGAHGGHYWAYICDRYGSSTEPVQAAVTAPVVSSDDTSSSANTSVVSDSSTTNTSAVSDSSTTNTSAVSSDNTAPTASKETENLGRWYEFNDSSVTPISVQRLTQVYGGRSSSAYMLVYVRRQPRLPPLPIPPPLPPSLEQRYAEQNRQLEVQREAYAQEIAKIRVRVFTLHLFKKDETTGRLFLRSHLEPPPPPPSTSTADSEETATTSKGHNDDDAGDGGLGLLGGDEDEDEDEDGGSELGLFAAFADLENLCSEQPSTAKQYTLADGCLTIRLDHGTTLKDFVATVAEAMAGCPQFPDADLRVDPMTLDERTGRAVVAPTLAGRSNEQVRQSETTLQALGLSNGSALLVWAGNEIDLSSYLNLNVLYYAPLPAGVAKVPAPVEHKLRVRDSFTVLDLKRALAELVPLAAEQQFVCKVDSVVRDLADDDKLLEDVGVRDGATVSVEELVRGTDKKRTPVSLAKRAFDEAESQLTITVLNRVTDTQQTVDCNPDESLRELKTRLFQLFGPFPDPSVQPTNLVLHWDDDGKPGLAMYDDARSLRGHSMSDGGVFHLTTARQSDERQVSFKFFVRLVDDDEQTTERRKGNFFTIVLPMNTPLSAAKQSMLKLVVDAEPQADGRCFRLRRTNWHQELLAILADERKTLDDCEVYEDTILCLEEGRVPQPGDITCWMQVYSFVPPDVAPPLIDNSVLLQQRQLAAARQASSTENSTSSDNSTTSDNSTSSDNSSTTNIPSASSDIPPTIVVDNADKPLPCQDSPGSVDAEAVALLPLEAYSPTFYRPKRELDVEDIPESIFFRGFLPLAINQSQTVAELKRAYLDAMQSGAFPRENMFASADGSVDDRWNNHAARQHLLGVDDPALLRLWSGTRLVSKDALSLKKAGIGNGSVVSAQVLAQPDSLHQQNDTLLWLYRFQPGSGERAPGTFDWLGESVFSTGDPTLARLREHVRAHGGDRLSAPAARLQIAKYFYMQKRWVLLAEQMGDKKPEPPSDAKMSDKARKRAEERRAVELSNLRKNDCKLSHGDLLVVFERPADDDSVSLQNYFAQFLDCPRLPLKRDPKRQQLRDSYERWGFGGSVASSSRPEEGIFILVDETEFLIDE